MMKKIIKYIEGLLNVNENTSFEQGVFLSFLLVELVVCVIGIFLNIVFQLGFEIITITVIALLTLLTFFYLARFKGIIKSLITPWILISYLFFVVIWFFDGGIYGPDLPIGLVVLLITLICVPNKQKIYFLGLFLFLFSTAFVVQYLSPDISYKHSFEEKWTENLISMIYSSVSLYLASMYIHRNYNLEKQKVEQREKELEIIKNQLAESNKTKDKFFSIIAHDLKNPFSAILGFSDLLIEDIENNEVENIKEYADIIKSSSMQAMNLLSNLMLWSRSQSGIISFNPVNTNIHHLANESIELLKGAASHKSIKITNNIPTNQINVVDKEMLSAIFRNLLSNSVKFTNIGGDIYLNANETDAELIISVADNGIGITKEGIENMFKLDANNSIPGTINEKGTGLGLIICKEFVEKHGGKIWVESQEFKGSVFNVSIPKSLGV